MSASFLPLLLYETLEVEEASDEVSDLLSMVPVKKKKKYYVKTRDNQ